MPITEINLLSFLLSVTYRTLQLITDLAQTLLMVTLFVTN